LRVDVDFRRGLLEAVPRFLDTLRRHQMAATFFVVTHANAPGRTVSRLRHAEYRRRLWRLGPWRAVRALAGSALSARGFLDGSARDVIRRIEDEGSELAVHGFDHAWWSDHVWSASEAEARDEIERAYDVLAGIVGDARRAWGSPHWRTTDAVLAHLVGRGVPYLADCFGREPFLTLDAQGRLLDLPHLPVTRPSLESSMLAARLPATAAIERLLSAEDSEGDVVCVHDYFEGLLHPGLFERVVSRYARAGRRLSTLNEVAIRAGARRSSLPRCPLERAPLPGFLGEVSFQGAAKTSTRGLALAR
jgi:peptidoglycan/xylan/chitin deacetylase (PgdA/CDA1 family)